MEKIIDNFGWHNTQGLSRISYNCGHCGNNVGSDKGYSTTLVDGRNAHIYICPSCTMPTFIDEKVGQIPALRFGRNVDGITDSGIESLYNEARDCTSVGAYTAAILLCRKILMNIAVQKGADEGKKFIIYVEYLESKGYVPPNGKAWVDVIRKKGNEATHEIKLMTQVDAEQILNFVEMLLRFIYEFPAMLENTKKQ